MEVQVLMSIKVIMGTWEPGKAVIFQKCRAIITHKITLYVCEQYSYIVSTSKQLP